MIPSATQEAQARPTQPSARGRWLHVCNGLDPRRDGGMVPSILGMTGALATRGATVRIVTPTASTVPRDRVPEDVRLDGPEADLERAVREAEVVHVHGLWQGHSRRVAREATRSRTPYLVAAHGMADPWALRQKRLKKLLYAALVEKPNLRGASCLHALTRPEVACLRRLAPRRPVALVPNGVDLAAFARLPDRSDLERELPAIRGKVRLLFFGRVHKKKGLDLLAPALRRVAADHPDVHLLVAGIDDGALAPFLESMGAAGLGHAVSYVGHLSGHEALRAWAAADAFVLPSHSEGFSMAVLEALACGLPAMITDACNFPELGAADAGMVVPATVGGVEAGLRALLERTDEQRRSLGRRGRALVESRYSWEGQGKQLEAVYRWIRDGGPRPEAVAVADAVPVS